MLADTGTSSAATIRAMTAAVRSAPGPALSGTPRDQATPALAVAIAFAPAPAIANRKLFILHQRNQTALSGLHIKGHDGDHEDMEQQFRQILLEPRDIRQHANCR
jgi:hypothetical protein